VEEGRMAKENRPVLRNQKGWKGFVWNTPKRRKIFDKVWHTIKWGKEEDSGAKEIIHDELKGKTIYKF
jgi:hypothetical protein